MSLFRPRRARRATTLAIIPIIVLFLLLGFIVRGTLPIVLYRPICPTVDPVTGGEYVDGPLRERFLWLALELLDRRGIPHLIYKGRLYTNSYEGPDDTFAANIARGVTIDDVFFPPPERLVRLLKETEPRWGPFPRLDERGNPIGGSDPRFAEDCDLFRAAVLKDEALEPGSRPRTP